MLVPVVAATGDIICIYLLAVAHVYVVCYEDSAVLHAYTIKLVPVVPVFALQMKTGASVFD